MALAAAACGADGLIIEVHNDPAHALCDGAQSLTPEEFDDRLAKKVRAVREVAGMTSRHTVGLGLIGGSFAKAYHAERAGACWPATWIRPCWTSPR